MNTSFCFQKIMINIIDSVDVDLDDDDVPLSKLSKSTSKSFLEEKSEGTLSLWQCFDQITSRESQKVVQITKRSESSIHEEFEMYLNWPLINRTENPTLWWKEKQQVFPKLRKMCLKFFPVPASSVYSERFFRSIK